MPQLDKYIFFNQTLYLIIIFYILYIFVKLIIVPKLYFFYKIKSKKIKKFLKIFNFKNPWLNTISTILNKKKIYWFKKIQYINVINFQQYNNIKINNIFAFSNLFYFWQNFTIFKNKYQLFFNNINKLFFKNNNLKITFFSENIFNKTKNIYINLKYIINMLILNKFSYSFNKELNRF